MNAYEFRLQETTKCMKKIFGTPPKEESTQRYLDEAFGDYISLVVSWGAFGYHRKKKPLQNLPTELPHSVKKMFFIIWSYPKCFTSTDFSYIDWNSHPPPFHRVNRGLSNFGVFKSVFGCKEGDEMVAEEPCSLF